MEPRTPDELAALQKYRSSILLTKEEITTLHKLRNASLLDENSPVPLELREKDFRGIDFFPIQGKYQLRLKFHKYENPETFQISLSNGQKVDALRAGYFGFELEGKKIRLCAYKKRVSDTEMFLPFKDKTSGKETYGAGRYLDLYGTSDDSYVLDFNLAYNPLCAFDEKKHDCPLPPAENWLMDLEIRAGEMKFKNRMSRQRTSRARLPSAMSEPRPAMAPFPSSTIVPPSPTSSMTLKPCGPGRKK